MDASCLSFSQISKYLCVDKQWLRKSRIFILHTNTHKPTHTRGEWQGVEGRDHTSVRFTRLLFHIFRLPCIFKDTLPCLSVTNQMQRVSGSLTTEPRQEPKDTKGQRPSSEVCRLGLQYFGYFQSSVLLSSGSEGIFFREPLHIPLRKQFTEHVSLSRLDSAVHS